MEAGREQVVTTTTHNESGNRSSVMTFRVLPVEKKLIAKAAKAERLEGVFGYVGLSDFVQ